MACALGATGIAQAASLDGAGRIVILPYAVSGQQRESTIYVTNPSTKPLTVHALYVGAEGTPFAASTQPAPGAVICADTRLDPGESIATTLSSLCPISTPDVENMGYLEFTTYGGFDAAPFEVSSLVDVNGFGHFGVEGVPTSAFDPGQTSAERTKTLRVHDLIGDVTPMLPAEFFAHCAVATMSESKTVTVQLQEYSSGVAKPLGSPIVVSLAPRRMEVLGDIFRRAGLPQGRFANVTAEFYAFPIAPSVPSLGDGADVIAWCSVDNRSSRLEDVRLAETPAPRDLGRSRAIVRGDSQLDVGPFKIGYVLPKGEKARMSVYLRHEDHIRCYLTESVVRPNTGIVPWQELRLIDPDGRVVAGGNDSSDTGIFSTGPKNARNRGVNERWTLEISWRETQPGDYSQIPNGNYYEVFGIECTATNGLSQLLPLDAVSDDF
jgi:hypothetical protein